MEVIEDCNFMQGSPNHLIFDNVGAYYQVAIYPANNNSGYLGRSGNAFQHIYSYNFHDLNSDLTQKENIKELNNSLDMILKLRGIRFDLKQEIAYDATLITDPKVKEKLEKERKNKIGFIGQEVIDIVPEAVEVDDSTGIYSIDYTRIIPILVNAMKEQNDIILKLEEEMKEIKIKSADEKNFIVTESDAYLGQNKPNPFNVDTYIPYYIPLEAKTAQLYFYNMSGTQIDSKEITEYGEGNYRISGGEYQAGMYVYCLVVDGSLINTKNMILTR